MVTAPHALATLPSQVMAQFDELVAGLTVEEQAEHAELINKNRLDLYANVQSVTSPWNVGNEVMRHLNERIGILSLTKNWNNLLMWAHYGDAHKGFIIGLDSADDFFSTPDSMGRATHPIEVRYQNSPQLVNVERSDHYRDLLGQKAECWSYEEEIRITRALPQDASLHLDANGFPVHLFHLPRLAIREIIIGANASRLTRARIIRFMRLQEIPAELYQAHFEGGSFVLHRRLVKTSFQHPLEMYCAHPYRLKLTRDHSMSTADLIDMFIDNPFKGILRPFLLSTNGVYADSSIRPMRFSFPCRAVIVTTKRLAT